MRRGFNQPEVRTCRGEHVPLHGDLRVSDDDDTVTQTGVPPALIQGLQQGVRVQRVRVLVCVDILAQLLSDGGSHFVLE